MPFKISYGKYERQYVKDWTSMAAYMTSLHWGGDPLCGEDMWLLCTGVVILCVVKTCSEDMWLLCTGVVILCVVKTCDFSALGWWPSVWWRHVTSLHWGCDPLCGEDMWLLCTGVVILCVVKTCDFSALGRWSSVWWRHVTSLHWGGEDMWLLCTGVVMASKQPNVEFSSHIFQFTRLHSVAVMQGLTFRDSVVTLFKSTRWYVLSGTGFLVAHQLYIGNVMRKYKIGKSSPHQPCENICHSNVLELSLLWMARGLACF